MRLIQTLFRAIVTLQMAVVLACSGLTGLVVCLGADGHVSLEPPHESGMCEHSHDSHHDDPQAEQDAFTTSQEAPCCGHCTDIPLPSHPSGSLLAPGGPKRIGHTTLTCDALPPPSWTGLSVACHDHNLADTRPTIVPDVPRTPQRTNLRI